VPALIGGYLAVDSLHNRVGQTIALRGLSGPVKARKFDRRHKPIVCPTFAQILEKRHAIGHDA